MTKLKFSVGAYHYMVHVDTDTLSKIRMGFEVFPVIECFDTVNKKSYFSYCDKYDNDLPYDGEFNPARTTKKMSGSVCWRGCWETRVYMVDGEEYWGPEFVSLATLFKENIVPWCKNYIKQNMTEYDISKYEKEGDY